MRWVCAVLAAVATTLSFPAHAASFAEWQEKAIGVIIQFEGSDLDKVTTDFDCQGLTIGKGQWTFERNSVKTLFDEVARRMGESNFARFLTTIERDGADAANGPQALSAAIAASRREDVAGALSIVRSWQQQMRDGQWMPLIEGECRKGHTRSSEVRLIPDAAPAKHLAAFLLDPTVAAAQQTLLSDSADIALERAVCWAKISRGASRPDFFEFLFFYDYLTQNGPKWIDDSELFDIVSRFDVEPDKPARDDRYMRPKMLQIRDWLSADFPYIRENVPATFRAHAQYAKQNAKTWFDLYAAGKLDTRQVKLLYVGLLRAMLGNNVFGYVAMNRRGTVVTGVGVVNNISHDFTRLYRESGALAEEEIEKVRARMRAKNKQQIARLEHGAAVRVDMCRP